jgi:CheY-like chemotaxis protein
MNFGAPILIIDDDLALAEVVKAGLEAAGQAATIARNAFHGLRLAREVKPAAIVCDMKMPDMSGGDVLRELASDPATAQIPRVLMTGYVDADRAHAHAFLLKPFAVHDMLHTLQSVTSPNR